MRAVNGPPYYYDVWDRYLDAYVDLDRARGGDDDWKTFMGQHAGGRVDPHMAGTIRSVIKRDDSLYYLIEWSGQKGEKAGELLSRPAFSLVQQGFLENVHKPDKYSGIDRQKLAIPRVQFEGHTSLPYMNVIKVDGQPWGIYNLRQPSTKPNELAKDIGLDNPQWYALKMVPERKGETPSINNHSPSIGTADTEEGIQRFIREKIQKNHYLGREAADLLPVQQDMPESVGGLG